MRNLDAYWQMISYGVAMNSFTNPTANGVGIDGVSCNEASEQRSWRHLRLFFDDIFEKRY